MNTPLPGQPEHDHLKTIATEIREAGDTLARVETGVTEVGAGVSAVEAAVGRVGEAVTKTGATTAEEIANTRRAVTGVSDDITRLHAALVPRSARPTHTGTRWIPPIFKPAPAIKKSLKLSSPPGPAAIERKRILEGIRSHIATGGLGRAMMRGAIDTMRNPKKGKLASFVGAPLLAVVGAGIFVATAPSRALGRRKNARHQENYKIPGHIV